MTGERIPDELKPGGELDKFVADLAARDEFSGTVLLTYEDRQVLVRSYGMANKERRIPNGPNTVFGLASVNKLFTGVAIGQLAQQGKVAYHEKVGTYLDGFEAEVADTVTVHHLLTHTSGFGRPANEPEAPPGSDEWDTIEEAWEGTLAYLRNLPLNFTPGTDYQYSNDGYFLLGAIVAEVSGQSFHDYLREHVFHPAGMSRTDVYTTEQRLDDPRIAHSYSTDESGHRVDITAEMPIWQAAGDPYSTAPDLARLARAMQDGTLLDEVFTYVTVTPKRPLPADDRVIFGTYAPTAHLRSGQWVLGHNGGGQGISTNVDWFPDAGWIAVVLTNYDSGTAEPVYTKARELITARRGAA